MATSDHSSRGLMALLHSCGEVAEVYQVPLESVVVHALSIVSALAGDLILTNPTGAGPTKANFSLFLHSHDPSVPRWMEREHETLLHRWQCPKALSLPNLLPRKKKRDLQRHLLAVESLGGRDDIEAHFIRAVIERTKHEKRFRPICPVSGGRESAARIDTGALPSTLLLRGARDLRTLVRGRGRNTGFWPLIAGTSDNTIGNLIGWTPTEALEEILKSLGPDDSHHLGWILGCSGTANSSSDTVEPNSISRCLLERLELLRFAKSLPVFKPSPEDVQLLNQQVENLGLRLEMLPEAQRAVAVPDRFLAWHLSGLLAAICGPGNGTHDPIAIKQCTTVGVTVAEYVVQNHLHTFRNRFPADRDLPLSGIDLRTFRFLGDQPGSVREMQRRFRGVNKQACLSILRKLTHLGLADLCDNGRFRKSPPPLVQLKLSDFLSESGLKSGNGTSPAG